ncbi:MAG: non-hydrolyzing UDP-N-acetylglucosamine 2-epimerase [Steroidobacteraceae bacterium]
MTQSRKPDSRQSIHLVAAARPNFMKVAPLYHALARESWCTVKIVHTGQHYDFNMSDAFFRDLKLPEPDFHLEVGSGSHAEQMGGVMIAYEKVCLTDRPDWIVVVGDVNSTAACALVGTKLWIPVVHLEAGLRSRDRRMPEEINRLVTDAIADLLWTPSTDGSDNLIAEGVSPAKIDLVGNIMIDSYEMMREQIDKDGTRQQFGLQPKAFGVVTLHRPSNVDDRATLELLAAQLIAASSRLPLVFAVHPRTKKRLEEFGLYARIRSAPGLKLTEPLGYIQFMNLVSQSSVAITDSGGVQEESTYLGIPCMTLRENTERPITVSEGSNRLVQPAELAARVDEVLAGRWPTGKRPKYWDGNTASRCVDSLKKRTKMGTGQ